MPLMPAKRPVTGQKTPHFEKPGAEVPDWEEPVERLVQALEQDEFELYAQRIIALAKPKTAPMAEVLLRMRQEEEMLLPPGSFLPVFERCGMMPELDRWVMRRAIARLARGSRVPSLSLNISGQTLSDTDFPPAVATELSRHRVPPASIAFEVLEEDALALPNSAEQFATAARKIGCCLTIDGFGYSPVWLAPLRALKPNYVKVDRVVIRNLSNQTVRGKLDRIVHAGKKLGIGVIGECVESDEALATLRAAGADFAQGYGIHVPAPIDEALKN
jgi:EAL domain-containing protein (putative c-di-GMP-specific phosphodiesterase class I)